MRLSLTKAAHVALFGTAYRKYGYLPGLADVGFHGCPRVTLYWQQVFMSRVIYNPYTQGPKFVESHISRKTSERWATRRLLRIEISLPAIAYPGGL
jgi:hypothetical protein